MTQNNPLVSIVVTTKNEEKNIQNCLESIKKQIYPKLEIIVVDNNSQDKTREIAKKYTKNVFNVGPERSAQRNYGAGKAKGEFLLFLDADMVLSKNVINELVKLSMSKKGEGRFGGIIIPEESFGIGFWAQVKKLERSFYINNNDIEAARFYRKDVFDKLGGFDLSITGPEDWDMSQRVREKYGLLRINSFIHHNEGNLSLRKSVYKKYYYSKKFSSYVKKMENKKYFAHQMSLIDRYKIFLSNPKKLFRNPILGVGVLVMKTLEFGAGGIGFLIGRNQK